MYHQVEIDPSARADQEEEIGGSHQILEDRAYKRLMMVNVVFLGARNAGDRNWVLVDTGVMGMSARTQDPRRKF